MPSHENRERSRSNLERTDLGDPYERLDASQRGRLEEFEQLVLFYNQKINLISRDTERHFRERHTHHSLAIARKQFPAGSEVVDWGTGGGLPVVPLAIAFPDVRFYAVDAVEKKLRVVQAIARRLDLKNLVTWHGRAESWPGQADYAISRATAPLVDLWQWFDRVRKPKIVAPSGAAKWKGGLIVLKGGDLTPEIEQLKQAEPDTIVAFLDLEPLLGSSYFRQKSLVHVSKKPFSTDRTEASD